MQKKTQIIMFKNGGKRKKGDEFKFKGAEIEIVNEFGYLGF